MKIKKQFYYLYRGPNCTNNKCVGVVTYKSNTDSSYCFDACKGIYIL